MQCWHCRRNFEILLSEKITFRAICEGCGAALHCCKQCRHYLPGKPNDCNVPGTEYIADREGVNHCEEFEPKTSFENLQSGKAEEVEKKLFGNIEKDPPKSTEERFKNLFRSDP